MENVNIKPEKETMFSRNLKKKYLPQIGAIIGKELKSESCKLEYKMPGGTFKCDNYIEIDGGAVIIENQYGDSDHDHLGKLFTYTTNLYTESVPITDVVWILIEGKGNVHTEHFEAVNFMNKFFEEKDIKFKIWLLIAERKDDEYTFREADQNDIRLRQEGKPLHPFMVRLSEAISKSNYGEPGRAGNEGKCLELSLPEKDYWINIPFRSREQKIKVEVIFDKKNIHIYSDMIRENFLSDLDEWLEKNEMYIQELIQYNISLEFAGGGDFAKICGYIAAETIDYDYMWDGYIVQIIDLLGKILSFANYEFEKYRP